MRLIRMSMLRNTPVIMGERQVGLLQSVCFDHTRKTVRALIVSGGMKGKRMVYARHVLMMTERFILIDGWQKCRKADQQQNGLFVRDPTGILAGRVTDYAIDDATLDVLAIEIAQGYLPVENHCRTWVYTYSPIPDAEEISIPVVLHGLPCYFKGGNEACGCPP